MESIPKVIELVVNQDLCTGCGLCIYECPTKALEMKWNENGFLVPEIIGNCDNDESCIEVCPFNPFPKEEVKTENELAEYYLHDTSNFHPKIGKYQNIYAGHAEKFRLTSSSGGIATFVLTDLLERGVVDYVFSVQEGKSQEKSYEYAISSCEKELFKSSKTRYFPVTLSTVFSKIDELDGKVAIVGVACFIKAIRLAQFKNPELKEKIPFLVGIICGGIKSRFFTEYLASKVGVSKENYLKPEFRIKNFTSTAGDYSFGCSSKINLKSNVIKMREVGDMWGTGYFKANACDFCDDVTTELADISVGDAWLEPYVRDGKGANVIVTRTKMADKIIQEGISSQKLNLEEMSLDKFISSQQGSFNHRQKGLNYRIKRAEKLNKLVPPKRFNNKKSLGLWFRLVQYFRIKTRKNSIYEWKKNPKSTVFDVKMKKHLLALKRVTRLYHLQRSFYFKFLKNHK